MCSLYFHRFTPLFVGCCMGLQVCAQTQVSAGVGVMDALKPGEWHLQSQRNQAIADFAKNQPVQTLSIDAITSSNAGQSLIQATPGVNRATLQEVQSLSPQNTPAKLQITAQGLRDAGQSGVNKVPLLLQTAASSLRFGSHNVVSPDGEDTIRLIRSLTAGEAQTAQTWADLKQNQTAEALNFWGWLYETGAFGVKVDRSRAQEFYARAAKFNYQPALYNLALGKAYGRLGSTSPDSALQGLANAMTLGKDESGRVCGVASFLAHKQSLPSAAVTYAHHCPSALATFVLARYTNQYEYEEKLRHLRNSIGTGADDGFPALLEAATAHAQTTPDTNFMTCKFAVMNTYRLGPMPRNVRALAQKCVDRQGGKKTSDFLARDQAVAGIDAYVVGELTNLKALRNSNKFRYSLPAPYLPFGQQELNLFEKYLPSEEWARL